MYSIIYSQGKFIHKDALTFPMEERGLQFGDGVYEVIRVYNGKAYLPHEHIARLYRSLRAIRITISETSEQLETMLDQLIVRNNVRKDSFIYLQITRGQAERNHIFPEKTVPNIYAYIKHRKRPIDLIKNGVKAITLADERWDNCYIKSLNLLPNVLARQLATEQNAYEAILHRNNIVTEGTSSNIFLVKDGSIYTHPESKRILSGCVRSAVLRFANNLNIPVHEKPFTLADIKTADEMFLTSSISEVIPIIQVNNQKVASGKPGEIATKLQSEYEKDTQMNEFHNS